VLVEQNFRMGFLSSRSMLFMAGRSVLALLGLCLLHFVSLPTHGQTRETDLKAAFLFNIAQFVDWPTNVFSSTNSPFVIGILGNSNPFGKVLDGLVKNEKISGHPMEIKQCRSLSDLPSCQIVFITASESGHLGEILRWLDDKPILTVSDMDDFTGRGGMIYFYRAQNKIRLRINMRPAKEAKLTISSKLLRLAEVIGQPSATH
jgi:hypothetical protein